MSLAVCQRPDLSHSNGPSPTSRISTFRPGCSHLTQAFRQVTFSCDTTCVSGLTQRSIPSPTDSASKRRPLRGSRRCRSAIARPGPIHESRTRHVRPPPRAAPIHWLQAPRTEHDRSSQRENSAVRLLSHADQRLKIIARSTQRPTDWLDAPESSSRQSFRLRVS